MSSSNFRYIHPPILFSYIIPSSTGTNPQTGPDLPSCSLFLKKKTFLFV
jgi:hypothetical protein